MSGPITARPSIPTKKHILILDIDDQYESEEEKKHILGGAHEFKIKLHEPINSKRCELYLDNVITYNCNITNDNDNCAFLLNLAGFNVHTSVASNSSEIVSSRTTHGNDIINGKIIIPNENDSVHNYYSSVIHKSKKLNYLADFDGKIDHLRGRITNLNGDPIFHGQQKSNNYTYSISNIRWNWNGMHDAFSGSSSNASFVHDHNGSITHLKKNTEFMMWSLKGQDDNKISCVLLNDTPIKAKTIMFSTRAKHNIVKDNYENASAVNMLFANRAITAEDFGVSHPQDIEDRGGIPSETSLGNYNSVISANIIMNLNLETKPSHPDEAAQGYPELYYDNGRFLAEFTLIEKNNN